MTALGPEWYYAAFRFAKRRELDPGAHYMLCTLLGYASEDGRGIYPSLERLARDIGASQSTVSRRLHSLVAARVLVKDQPGGYKEGGGATTIYHVDLAVLERQSGVTRDTDSGLTEEPQETIDRDLSSFSNSSSSTHLGSESGLPGAQPNPWEPKVRELSYAFMDLIVAKGWKEPRYRGDALEEKRWLTPIRSIVMAFPYEHEYLPAALAYIVEHSERSMRYPLGCLSSQAVRDALCEVLPEDEFIGAPHGRTAPEAPPEPLRDDPNHEPTDATVGYMRDQERQDARAAAQEQEYKEVAAKEAADQRAYAERLREYDRREKAKASEGAGEFMSKIEAILHPEEPVRHRPIRPPATPTPRKPL